jgi:inorganic pyrophosphatase
VADESEPDDVTRINGRGAGPVGAPGGMARVNPGMRLDRLKPLKKGDRTVRVVIETSRGSRNKYSYDTEEQVFLLKKTLPEGHVFPFDFGFVPRTEGEDGDPLDVLVLMDAPAFPGCVVECRIIGCVQARQTKKGKMVENDRFLAVAENSVTFKRVRDVDDLAPEMIEQIEHFFISYNEMAGKKFKVRKIESAKPAERAIARASG